MPVGRPRVMTKEVIETIEEELKNGATIEQSCFLANVSVRSLYNYFDEYPEFKERCRYLQDLVSYRARKNVVKKINSGDINESHYWLDRKDKEFKPKNDLTSDDKQLPAPLLYAIQNHKSDNQDTQAEKENKDNTRRNISEQDSKHPDLLDTLSTER